MTGHDENWRKLTFEKVKKIRKVKKPVQQSQETTTAAR